MQQGHFDDHARAIAKRQYFQPEDNDVFGMFRRVARFVAQPEPEEQRKVYEDTFYELMATKRFCPGGRVLAGAATGHGNVLNCFGGETRTYTVEHGLVPLSEIVGQDVTVLSLDGSYEKATIKEFGEQQLYQIVLSNGKTIRATADHEWLVTPRDNSTNGGYRVKTTKELVGKRLPILVTEKRPERNEDFNAGFRHGAVFGDGSLSHYRKKTDEYVFELRMFGDGVSIQGMFDDLRDAPYCDKVAKVVTTDKNLKELPSDDETASYWYGFFCGLLATDGHCDERGSAVIHNADKSVLDRLAYHLPRFGIGYASINETRSANPYDGTYKPVFGMRLLKYTLQEEDFYRESSRLNFNDQGDLRRTPSIEVVSVEPDAKEVVYCATVPSNNIFNIEGFLTKNCFVQDGSPEPEGTDDWVLRLATKLALVTKVGGGNGLCLDPLKPKTPYTHNSAKLKVTISQSHPDYIKVKTGTFMDLALGKYVSKEYRFLEFVEPDELDADSEPNYIKVGDSVGGIWDSASKAVKLLLSGNDVAIDLSDLRPEGQPVKGSGGTSSGPSSFAVEIFDNFGIWASLGGADHAGPVATLRYVFAPTLRVVKQGGSRRGAGMATISATHEDIDDFITCKDLEREQAEGDISTFNISVLGTKEFMLSKSQTLLEIAEHAWQTGEPGFLFIDRINDENAVRDVLGDIKCSNPCGEIPLYPGEPCDLGAMNLSAYVVTDEDGSVRFDRRQFSKDVYTLIRFLDNILDVNTFALEDNREMSHKLRRLGLGVMGLADMLIKMGYRYNSQEGRDLVDDVITLMRDVAVKASKELGKERGIPECLQKAGLDRRNVALLTVAPTGTTSMLMGTTGGVEPTFAPFIYRRIGDSYVALISPLFAEKLEQYPPHPDYTTYELEAHDSTSGVNQQSKEWDMNRVVEAIQENHGSVQGLDFIPEDIRHVYVCAHDIKPADHVLMQATVQKAFDGGGHKAANSISKTINLPKSATVSDVLDAYALAYEEGCKGITVYRDGSRQFQVLSTKADKDTKKSKDKKAGEGSSPTGNNPDQSQEPIASGSNSLSVEPILERPERLEGFTDSIKLRMPNGAKRSFYVTVNSKHGIPTEVMVLSGKAGDESNADSEALGRLVSIALQYGVPVDVLVKTLSGINGGMYGTYQHSIVSSKASMIAVALQSTLDDKVLEKITADAVCPVCGAKLTFAEGCQTCYECGYSKCG